MAKTKRRFIAKCIVCGQEQELLLHRQKTFKYCSPRCRAIGLFSGKPKSDKWRQKASRRMKRAYTKKTINMQGANNPMYGRKRPDMAMLHNDLNFTKKRFQNMHLKPNRKERILGRILEQHHFDFKYVGDGAFFVGRCCPDFLHKNETQIIELFGDYWHLPEDEEKRIKYFASKGFSTLIIWEHELQDVSQIVERVRDFMKQPQEQETST